MQRLITFAISLLPFVGAAQNLVQNGNFSRYTPPGVLCISSKSCSWMDGFASIAYTEDTPTQNPKSTPVFIKTGENAPVLDIPVSKRYIILKHVSNNKPGCEQELSSVQIIDTQNMIFCTNSGPSVPAPRKVGGE